MAKRRNCVCACLIEGLEQRTLLAAILGTVIDGINDNAVADLAPDGKIGEAGVAGWTVYVDYNGNNALDEGEPSAVTGNYGQYEITDVPSGSHFVRQVPRAGWRLGQAALVATLTDGNDATDINFASTARARIGGKVFYDVNSDGQRDAGDYPLVGWGVYIDANDNSRFDPGERRVLTKADGAYVFTAMEPGSYTVRLMIPGNWSDQPTNRPSNMYRPSLSLASISRNRDFGLVPGGIISGVAYDWFGNFDHIRQPGQAGLPGIRVYIDDDNDGQPDSPAREVLTDALGVYRLEGLSLGTHRVYTFSLVLSHVDLTVTADQPVVVQNLAIVLLGS